MDFLDTKKMRRHALMLYVGYVFIGIAVLISAIVLMYQANGFGVNGKGEIVQNGLVFVSSQPSPAKIYLNGTLNNAQTNSRLSLPSGSYSVRLERDGYRNWTRTINVQGGDVQNFDYPFLIPKDLQTDSQDALPTAPGIVSQSRDRRWLLLQTQLNANSFKLYDLKADDVTPENFTLPTGVVTAANGAESWEAIQWANDNEHVLLKHTYGTGAEYLIVSRTSPQEAVNLNKNLGVNPGRLVLIDNKYDLYHVLIDGKLSSARLGQTNLEPIAENVLEFKSYGTKMVVYVTPSSTAGKASVKMVDDGKTYELRQVTQSDTYAVDTAQYRGDQYVVIAASNEQMAYIYKNPVQQLNDGTLSEPLADRALRVQGATHVSFSPNTQFILAQNGQSFGVYDLYLKRPYTYRTDVPLDAPQQHAEWMDGFHLTYISGGKQIIADYDQRNRQTLMDALPAPYAHFSQDYRYVFSIAQNQAGSFDLNRTGLRTEADL